MTLSPIVVGGDSAVRLVHQRAAVIDATRRLLELITTNPFYAINKGSRSLAAGFHIKVLICSYSTLLLLINKINAGENLAFHINIIIIKYVYATLHKTT